MNWADLRAIWNELNTPSDFMRSWYGWATNQAGHTLVIGMVFPVVIFLAWFFVTGTMPYRWIVAAGIVGPYLCVEHFVQGWTRRDSMTDAWFVALGAAAATQPWLMTGTDGVRYVDLRLDTWWMAGIVFVWLASLFLGVRRRYIASR